MSEPNFYHRSDPFIQEMYDDLRYQGLLASEFTIDQWLCYIRKMIIMNWRNQSIWITLRYGLMVLFFIELISLVVDPHAIVSQLFPVALIMSVICMILIFPKKFETFSSAAQFESFIIPMLVVFKQDVDEDKKVQLYLYIRKPECDQEIISNQTLTEPGYPCIKDREYLNIWIHGCVTLCDGNRLAWKVKDLYRRRDIKKFNYINSKTKSKHKYKIKRDISVSISFKNSNYLYLSNQKGIQIKRNQKQSVLKYNLVKNHIKYQQVLDRDDFLIGVSNIYKTLLPAV